MEAIKGGMFMPSMKDEMVALESRKASLEAELESNTEDAPVLLHPGLADRYRNQVSDLTVALNSPSSRAEATSILRGLLSEVRLVPEGDGFAIELVGELAGLLALGLPQNEQRRPKAACSTVLVAGAGFEPATFRL